MIYPTIRQLRYLVVLTETRHFGRAADRCAVTQPTLSSGIKELEAMLGVQLFERTKRQVIPTLIGLDLSQRAQLVLRSIEDMVDVARSTGEPLSGPLRMGAIPTIGPFFLPRVLPLLRRQFKSVQPYLREDQTERLLAQLAAGELDVLILALPYDLPGTKSYILGDDKFYLAVPRTHPLALRKRIRADEVPSGELLLLEEGHCLREHALAACHIEDSHGSDVVKGTSLYTLVQMVASGLGVTLVPEMALKSDILKGADVVTIPLVGDAPPRQIALVWRKTSGRDAEFCQLGDLISGLWN